MNGMQRLVQAERDCVELHQALAEAIKRLSSANARGVVHGAAHVENVDDLLAVLERSGGRSKQTIEGLIAHANLLADEAATMLGQHAMVRIEVDGRRIVDTGVGRVNGAHV